MLYLISAIVQNATKREKRCWLLHELLNAFRTIGMAIIFISNLN